MSVLSQNKFLSENEIELMKKLNKKKIRWIIREVEKGELSLYRIAKQQKITPRWVRIIVKRHASVPLSRIRILKCGRKPKLISEEEKNRVLDMREKYPFGAVNLEKLIDTEGLQHIPHNKIHRILKEHGLAENEPKKRNKRKWVRYERRRSNSLWHGDWFEKDGKNIIIFEDDASRLITGFGIFNNATAENSKKVLEEAIRRYGKPKQLITDHGTQFTSLPRETCANPEPNEFQKFLKEQDIEHLKARVKHPQTNGKVERVFQTLYKCKEHFGSWEMAVEFYNFKRPHMSLENGKLRTPYHAFLDKMRKPK